MSDEINRTLGAHEADIAHLQKTVDSLAEDVRAIRSTIDESRGGWKAIMLIGGISSTLGGLVVWIITRITGPHG